MQVTLFIGPRSELHSPPSCNFAIKSLTVQLGDVHKSHFLPFESVLSRETQPSRHKTAASAGQNGVVGVNLPASNSATGEAS